MPRNLTCFPLLDVTLTTTCFNCAFFSKSSLEAISILVSRATRTPIVWRGRPIPRPAIFGESSPGDVVPKNYGAPFVAKIDDARISARVNIDRRSQQSIVDHNMQSIVDHSNRSSITAIDRRSQQSIVDHSNRSSIIAIDGRS